MAKPFWLGHKFLDSFSIGARWYQFFFPQRCIDDWLLIPVRCLADGRRQQLGMWRTDGTNYVLNILLTAPQDFTGGEFLFHNGTVDTFNHTAKDQSTIEVASVPEPGDALFIYGSKLFHGVKPVSNGRRMSLVLSFHCPYTQEDANRFWHLASDDGIPSTVKSWIHLQRALTESPEQQYQTLGIEPISFAEVFRNESKPKD